MISRYVVLTKQDKRPHMLGIHHSSGIQIFGLTFLDSPQFHVYLTDVENVHVNRVNVTVDVEAQTGIHKRQRGLKLRTSTHHFLFASVPNDSLLSSQPSFRSTLTVLTLVAAT